VISSHLPALLGKRQIGKRQQTAHNACFTTRRAFMRSWIAVASSGVISCLLAGLAQAQTTKPGLWEVKSKMSSSSNPQLAKQMEEAQKAMANMPPAQRKMMEDMMAKQGVSMSASGDGATVLKLCISPEMAKLPPVQQRQGCTYNTPARVGNTQKFSFQCSNPAANGEGEVTYSGSDAYNGKMRITTERNGKPETMNMETSGKFLGSDCGDIKPISLPKG
jgi:Protein of unknown function (DUF3617)